jgi:hypothetical protein
MKSHKYLLTSFVLGLAWLGSLYLYSVFFTPDGTIHTVAFPQFVLLITLVIAIFCLAVVSLIKKESTIGAIVVIMADFILFVLSFMAYKGID